MDDYAKRVEQEAIRLRNLHRLDHPLPRGYEMTSWEHELPSLVDYWLLKAEKSLNPEAVPRVDWESLNEHAAALMKRRPFLRALGYER
jgi:hypothetical protein